MLAGVLAQSAPAQYRQRSAPLAGSPNLNWQLVKTGLYLITGEGSNSLVRLSGNGLIIVDDKLPGNYEGLVSRAQKISEQNIRLLFLTGLSPENTGNLDQFMEDHTMVVAQDTVADGLLAQKLVSPAHQQSILRFDRQRSFPMGGIVAQALYFGRAHSGGDTVVYFPNLKTVAIGRLYAADLDLAAGGSLVNWSTVLDQLLKLDFDTAVAAHGDPISRTDLVAFKSRLDSLTGRARALVSGGVSADELMSRLRTDDPDSKLTLTPEQVRQFYAELAPSGQPAGGR
jgi:hypothetical protein